MNRAAGGVFVTGTDTEVGKTLIGSGLLHAMGQRGLRTAGYKPIAAGCESTPEGWRNEDALALSAAATLELAYEAVNPVALADPIAPHLAAEREGRRLAAEPLIDGYRQLAAEADWVLMEGAGGWRVPLNETQTLAALPAALGLPVILVVAIRLGCISHALLTAEAIAADGLALAGWVANVPAAEDTTTGAQIESIRQRLGAPLLGVVPRLDAPDPAAVGACLDIQSLFDG